MELSSWRLFFWIVSAAGKFTAPVRGVYTFNFAIYSDSPERFGVDLIKNLGSTNEFLAANYVSAPWNYLGHNTDNYLPSTLVLMLEPGDTVCVRMRKGSKIVWSHRRSVFSGFLIYPL